MKFNDMSIEDQDRCSVALNNVFKVGQFCDELHISFFGVH
jgi:hypothetical protein